MTTLNKSELSLKLESVNPDEKISDAETVQVTITGPKEEVIFFVESAFLVQESVKVLEVKEDGEIVEFTDQDVVDNIFPEV